MPSWLNRESFSSYPLEGKTVALSHLDVLNQIPEALLPVFLVDLRTYDWKFPIEQQEIARRLEFIRKNPSSLAGFRNIRVPPAGNVGEPRRLLAEVTAYLWSSLQMESYHKAANDFVASLGPVDTSEHSALTRLVMIMVGRDAGSPKFPLFEKLRPFGQVRTNVRVEDSAQALIEALGRRSGNYPAPYAHWYVDGGDPLNGIPAERVSQLVYPSLATINKQVLQRMMSCIDAGSGPEVLQMQLAELSEQPVLADTFTSDPRLRHFAVSLFAEGSGTQIFSTSFVQWSIREILRRAQPETLLARFAPRQRQKSFNTMVRAAFAGPTDFDPDGSLVDAEMGAYYAYLEIMKLNSSKNLGFIVLFEKHSQLFVAGRGIPAGTVNNSLTNLARLISELGESA